MIPQPQFPPKNGPAPMPRTPILRPPKATGWRRVPRFFLDHIDRVSLTTKLVACTLVVLIVGTVGISASIRQLVSSYLLEKTDSQIISQRNIVMTGTLLSDNSDLSNNGLNTYFLQVRAVKDGKLTGQIDTRLYPVLEGGVVSIPQLPSNDDIDLNALGQPFTTSAVVTTVTRMNADAAADSSGQAQAPAASTPGRKTLDQANAPWRVAAFQSQTPDKTVKAIVFIGLSLADQIDIIDTLTKYCVTVGIAIVLLGGSLAALIIQRTLDPLKRIEKTAAKIAAGDLTQRVPWAPENTEIGSLAVSLNTMLARIEKSFHEQEQTTAKMKRFVSDASHELRTPLAAIHGYAELYTMQRGMPGALERADESIAHIERSSQRMTVLVEDLLSLARLDEGRGIDMTQTVSLTGVVADALDDLHALDPEREVTRGTVAYTPAADLDHPSSLAIEAGDMTPVTLTGDASRLRQVVTNIVGNIHRYTPADSPARIGLGVMPASITPDALAMMPATDESMRRFLDAVEVGRSMRTGTNYAVLRFEDHGPGVPEESRAQIFERFYTADPSRAREKGGTGLGLAIAQSVVKAHHGFICATPTDGGGLTFTIILPLGPVDAAGHPGPAPDDADDTVRVKSSRGFKSKEKPAKTKRSWFSH
ncbi:sensor histidine kinase [Bifidobacterium parmae]|uniref:histidine kinase n=1 Tax=Bifidobacterium parmae TaxID=361854 RepID=A0A2N5J490_9BIFI|nr:HAMP domain-containing sensor histidine kinase [Bifidobacterium parmae]PLS29026.1 histidine kinase [Bifidobacterium parmae]